MNDRAGGGGRKVRGVAIGVVTNIKTLQWGRVKVQLPWLDDQVESHWAGVTGWYAGNCRGTMYIPEVGDEVLVSFEGGGPNHPRKIARLPTLLIGGSYHVCCKYIPSWPPRVGAGPMVYQPLRHMAHSHMWGGTGTYRASAGRVPA